MRFGRCPHAKPDQLCQGAARPVAACDGMLLLSFTLHGIWFSASAGGAPVTVGEEGPQSLSPENLH